MMRISIYFQLYILLHINHFLLYKDSGKRNIEWEKISVQRYKLE